MAADPSDFKKEHYEFGNCSERIVYATATCDLFKSEETVRVRISKCGNWVDVCIPNMVLQLKPNITSSKSTIKIESFLNEDELGKSPRKRFFWCLPTLPEHDNIRVPAIVTLEADGTILLDLKNTIEGPDGVTRQINYYTGNPVEKER